MINYTAYSDMLTEQVDMCFPFENVFFQKYITTKISRIGEIGCGNGKFLKKLHSHYPLPFYKGYDHCKELIKLANTIRQNNLHFEIGSVNNIEDNYDLIILRLIVHQLTDRTSFFKILANKLKANSQLIIIEPYDDMFYISPSLSIFNAHLEKHRGILSPNNASRDVKSYLEEELKYYGLILEEQFYYYIPSLLPEYKDKYYRYMKSTGLIFNCEKNVLDEIDTWYHDTSSLAQIGLIFLRFLKREQ